MMSNDQYVIKYVKHNKVRIKADVNRDELTKILLEFFEKIKEQSTRMKGFMVMDDLEDLTRIGWDLPSGKEKKIWILFINQKTISYLS